MAGTAKARAKGVQEDDAGALNPGGVVNVPAETRVPFGMVAKGATIPVPAGRYEVVADPEPGRGDAVPVNHFPARLNMTAARTLVADGLALVVAVGPAADDADRTLDAGETPADAGE